MISESCLTLLTYRALLALSIELSLSIVIDALDNVIELYITKRRKAIILSREKNGYTQGMKIYFNFIPGYDNLTDKRSFIVSDLKSKMPDFKEISSMAGKFFKDLKNSIDGIVQDYKKKRHPSETKAQSTAPTVKPTTAPKAEAKPVQKPKIDPAVTVVKKIDPKPKTTTTAKKDQPNDKS